MTAEKIAITISPHIEEIFSQKKYNELYRFFKDLIGFSKELKNCVLVFLPHIFQYGFKNCDNSLIKTLYFQICIPNSNIIFFPDGNHCNLSLLNMDHTDLLVDLSSIGVLSEFLRGYKIPLILSTENYTYYKDECKKDSCFNLPCSKMLELNVSDLLNKETFLEKLRENCNKNLNEWIIYKNNIQISDFRNMFYFAAFSMNVQNELYDKIKEIEFLDEYILKDIKNETPYVLKDIATSILRSFFFTPAGDRNNRVKNSIDYHQNTPCTKNGYDLLRLDVTDMKYSGYKDGHSGARRILLARKKDKKYVIAYVPDHEFSESLINSRIQALESKITKNAF